ncbi:MAG: hypothetical protein JF600_08405 [Xanthomonadales bacterium]|nr:hypothetical protein [Xanthomonadales bacterium]
MIRLPSPRASIAGAAAAMLAALLAACGSTPVASTWIGPSPEQLVSEIRAAGAAMPGELDVQPLRDPMVEDLRVRAARAERTQRYAEAAADLDKALALSPDDPGLLQERAEAAVLEKDLAKAEALARRAFGLGGKVGPLCRRHWMTIRQSLAQHQSRLMQQQAAGHMKGEVLDRWEQDMAKVATDLELARRDQDACTVSPPPRY